MEIVFKQHCTVILGLKINGHLETCQLQTEYLRCDIGSKFFLEVVLSCRLSSSYKQCKGNPVLSPNFTLGMVKFWVAPICW